MAPLEKYQLAPGAAKMFPTLRGRMLINWLPNPAPNTMGYWPQCTVIQGEYQVGLLEGFEESDPVFYTLDGARYYAKDMCIKQHAEIYPAAYAVWDNETGRVASIHYLGDIFT